VSPRLRTWAIPGAVAAALALLALALRPLLPIDETRYVSVAWEMWARGDFLVPYLNGKPYSHKPPLLFWLFQLGWAVFGVNEWWPRLVPPLFAIGGLALTARLANRLWPGRDDVAGAAVWILSGSLLWVALLTFMGFDTLLLFFTLVGVLGIARAAQGESLRGFAMLGAAIGLGVLAKGPVILLLTLPAALAAPWWMRPRPSAVRWYSGVLASVALGAAIALAWALPAANAGGTAYREAIFWRQTAGRVVPGWHRHPWWWYLLLLPILLFPWSVWPPLWRGLARLAHGPSDPGLRLALAWLLPPLAVFSLMSGKQPQYLLPLVPGFALLGARALYAAPDRVRRYDTLAQGLVFAVVGVAWTLAALVGIERAPAWLDSLSPLPGAVLVVSGVALAFQPLADLARRVAVLALSSAFLLALAYAGLAPVIGPYQDVRPLAAYLAPLAQAGHPIAYYDYKYHGEYHFLARLREPFAIIDGPNTLREWIRLNPDGRLVVYRSTRANDEGPAGGEAIRWDPAAADYTRPYRGGHVCVFGRAAILAAVGAPG
jgi:4-amino-4-deoxy-L-arabinose transferase-like glycosyltransferase